MYIIVNGIDWAYRVVTKSFGLSSLIKPSQEIVGWQRVSGQDAGNFLEIRTRRGEPFLNTFFLDNIVIS